MLNEKRDQQLDKKSADKKAYYLDMIKKDTGVDAKHADVAEEFAFPAEDGVDGRMAEIGSDSDSDSESVTPVKKNKVKKVKGKVKGRKCEGKEGRTVKEGRKEGRKGEGRKERGRKEGKGR